MPGPNHSSPPDGFTPHGMWSPAAQAGPVSQQTRDLLKTMMAESRLTAFQRRQLSDAVNKSGSLPSECHPTTSQKKRETNNPPEPGPREKIVNPRNAGKGIRLQGDIIESGAYDRERYRTIPCKVRTDKEKERLSNMMAFGTDLDPTPGKARPRSPSPLTPEEDRDRFEELMDEIQERKAFLDRMTALGKGKEVKSRIETEISQRIREMEDIDATRRRELEAKEKG